MSSEARVSAIFVEFNHVFLLDNFTFRRFAITKTAKNDNEQSSTCQDESTTTENNAENGKEDQPPEKKKRLSNREYKKMMKGQNKVSLRQCHF